MVSIKSLLLNVALLVTIQYVFAEILSYEKCNNPGDFALTFDDGPSELTSMVLDVLKKENIKATFFINGNNYMDIANQVEAQELIKREATEGHVIGSHTYTHPSNMTTLTNEQFTQELKPLNDIVFNLTGLKPAFFRPPEGKCSEANKKVLESLGFTAIIYWNLDPAGWNANNNDKVNYFKHLVDANRTTDSFIALNHDTSTDGIVSNLQVLITIIKNIGYHFVSIDECIGLSAYQNVNSLEGKNISKPKTISNVNIDEKENNDDKENNNSKENNIDKKNLLIYIGGGSLLLIFGSFIGAVIVKNNKSNEPSKYIYGTGDNGDIIIYERQTMNYNNSINEENVIVEPQSNNLNNFNNYDRKSYIDRESLIPDVYLIEDDEESIVSLLKSEE